MIDGLGTEAVPKRDVLIQDGRIARIAVTTMIADIPENAKIIDGEGLTVMPGIIDGHTHMGGIDYSVSNLNAEIWKDVSGMEIYQHMFAYGSQGGIDGMQRYNEANLYAGVTTIVEVGGSDEISTKIRDEIIAGSRLGPNIHTVGDTIESIPGNTLGVMQLTSEEVQAEIKGMLDAKAARGIEFIKLYAGISPWQARHIMTAARKRGMRGIADFWCMNNSQEVIETGLFDSYAHGGCVEVSEEEARWFAENDKFAMFTLDIFDTMRGERGWPDYEEQNFFRNPLIVDIWGKEGVQAYYDSFLSLREQWHDGEKAGYTEQLWGNKLPLLDLNMKNLMRMYQGGVTIFMGTDANWPPGNWPGEGMHYELELHVRAGIPPIDAIRMATYNGAKFIRRENEIGSVEKGKKADLLIVKGNPAEKISDTRNIVYVIKDGRILDRDSLKKR